MAACDSNFVTVGWTCEKDDRWSARNVLLPSLHNPRRCLLKPVYLVSNNNACLDFITLSMNGDARCSVRASKRLKKHATGIAFAKMLFKWDAVVERWSTPPADRKPVFLLKMHVISPRQGRGCMKYNPFKRKQAAYKQQKTGRGCMQYNPFRGLRLRLRMLSKWDMVVDRCSTHKTIIGRGCMKYIPRERRQVARKRLFRSQSLPVNTKRAKSFTPSVPRHTPSRGCMKYIPHECRHVAYKQHRAGRGCMKYIPREHKQATCKQNKSGRGCMKYMPREHKQVACEQHCTSWVFYTPPVKMAEPEDLARKHALKHAHKIKWREERVSNDSVICCL